MKHLKELEEKYRQLGEEIEKLKCEQELIPVPENIHIARRCSRLSIVNGNSHLSLRMGDDSWTVWELMTDWRVNAYLKKVDRSEIKAGDLFFRFDIGTPSFAHIIQYAVAIEDEAKTYCYWHDSLCVDVSNSNWKH